MYCCWSNAVSSQQYLFCLIVSLVCSTQVMLPGIVLLLACIIFVLLSPYLIFDGDNACIFSMVVYKLQIVHCNIIQCFLHKLTCSRVRDFKQKSQSDLCFLWNSFAVEHTVFSFYLKQRIASKLKRKIKMITT